MCAYAGFHPSYLPVSLNLTSDVVSDAGGVCECLCVCICGWVGVSVSDCQCGYV